LIHPKRLYVPTLRFLTFRELPIVIELHMEREGLIFKKETGT